MKKKQLHADPFSRLRSGLWVRNLNLPKEDDAICPRCGGVKRGRYSPKVPGTRFGMPGYPCCCNVGGGGTNPCTRSEACTGLTSNQYSLTISGFPSACNIFNDTFILTFSSEVGVCCQWSYLSDDPEIALYINICSVFPFINVVGYAESLYAIEFRYNDTDPIDCTIMDIDLLLTSNYYCPFVSPLPTAHITSVE